VFASVVLLVRSVAAVGAVGRAMLRPILIARVSLLDMCGYNNLIQKIKVAIIFKFFECASEFKCLIIKTCRLIIN